MKKTSSNKYGIYDAVTHEGLSNYPYFIEWDATFEDGGFHLFDTKEDAVHAALELTKLFLESDKNCEIRWQIVEISQIIEIKQLVKVVDEIV